MTGAEQFKNRGNSRNWPATIPWWAVSAGLSATLLVGAVAGLYPALRAARLSPTTALAS